jgi:Zn-dependent peptidase ImmA (M78 family)
VSQGSRLRRGFKTEANTIAREIRQELGLRLTAPLDPWKLATYLAVPVVPLQEFAAEAPAACRLFTRQHRASFSAVTVFCGSERMIVFNHAHSAGRQASDLAHELAHVLLFHPPSPALDHRGCRQWDPEAEDEAAWLAGALLISDEAALDIAARGLTDAEAAIEYGVSEHMMRFRMNVTKARVRIQRGGWR